MTPHAIAFTWTLLGASSFARAFVNPLIPDLDAEYATSQEAPESPHIEEMLMILPERFDTIGSRDGLPATIKYRRKIGLNNMIPVFICHIG